jgi:hypothetical protein
VTEVRNIQEIMLLGLIMWTGAGWCRAGIVGSERVDDGVSESRESVEAAIELIVIQSQGRRRATI